MNWKNFTTRIEPNTYKRLKKISYELLRPLSELIREGIQFIFDKYEKKDNKKKANNDN